MRVSEMVDDISAITTTSIILTEILGGTYGIAPYQWFGLKTLLLKSWLSVPSVMSLALPKHKSGEKQPRLSVIGSCWNLNHLVFFLNDYYNKLDSI